MEEEVVPMSDMATPSSHSHSSSPSSVSHPPTRIILPCTRRDRRIDGTLRDILLAAVASPPHLRSPDQDGSRMRLVRQITDAMAVPGTDWPRQPGRPYKTAVTHTLTTPCWGGGHTVTEVYAHCPCSLDDLAVAWFDVVTHPPVRTVEACAAIQQILHRLTEAAEYWRRRYGDRQRKARFGNWGGREIPEEYLSTRPDA